MTDLEPTVPARLIGHPDEVTWTLPTDESYDGDETAGDAHDGADG